MTFSDEFQDDMFQNNLGFIVRKKLKGFSNTVTWRRHELLSLRLKNARDNIVLEFLYVGSPSLSEAPKPGLCSHLEENVYTKGELFCRVVQYLHENIHHENFCSSCLSFSFSFDKHFVFKCQNHKWYEKTQSLQVYAPEHTGFFSRAMRIEPLRKASQVPNDGDAAGASTRHRR